jgi:outer membrane protein TolC
VVLRQELPWPSERRAERDAANAEADAVEARFRATWLSVRREVVDAVMELWAVDRLVAIDREQLEITGSIADATLGALRIGEATLADQQQVELQRARLEDRLVGRAEQRRIVEARLRATLGLGPAAILPALPSTRPPTLPAESEEDLAFAQIEHPMVQMPTAMAAAAEAMERRHRALALPGLGVGVEWMRMPGAMGDRAVSPMISLRLPFAGRRHRTSAHGADAERLAWEAERQAAANDTAAALTEALILVRDSARRIATLTTTLIPQADAVGSSRLGAYRVGRGMVGDALMAQRELVELRGELVEAEREHELAWAMLEEAVGRPVRRRTVEAGGVVTHLEDGSGTGKEPRPQDAEREETP